MSFIDANRSILPTSPLLLSVSQLGISYTNGTAYYLYLTNVSASHWLILIDPLQTGSFTITFTFSQTGYVTTTITLVLTVKNNAFMVQYTNNTSWTNSTSFTRNFNQGSKDNVTLNLTTKDTTYSVNATDAVLSSSNTTNYIIYLQNLGGGMWYVLVNPSQSGMFIINIYVNQYGYNQTTITFTIIVNQTPASAIYGTISYISAMVPVNTALTNDSSYTQTFSQGNQDEFNFTFSSNDTIYSELINGSLAYNASSSSFYSITYIQLSNNTFFITLNPTNIGSYSVEFTIYRSGYSNATLILNFIINKAKLVVVFNQNPLLIQNATFASDYTFIANITSNFDLKTVNGTTLLSNSNYLSIVQLPNGSYAITYDRSRYYLSGTESNVFITLNAIGFDANTTYWTFTINPPTSPLPTTVSSSNNTPSSEWNNTNTITMTWYDPNTTLKLNTNVNLISWNVTSSDVFITVVANGNGQYTIKVTPMNVGTYTVKITFTDPALASYFTSASYIIIVTGTK